MSEHILPTVKMIGIPCDFTSSHLRGAAAAPPAIRAALFGGSSNLCSEFGVDLKGNNRFIDSGDLAAVENIEQYQQITHAISELVSPTDRPLIIGGDHAITYPVMRAIVEHHGPVNILHFDAHPDLYDNFEGNRYSHACPFARIMEAGLAKRLVQVGIRTLNEHQSQQAEKYGVEIHAMNTFCASSFEPSFEGPVYVSFDIDGLDPAYAPGVSHHEPGGLSVREALRIIQSIDAPIIGADVVELNPERDINGMTAMVAAKLVKELAGKMLA
ncbi:MAG: arginase [Lysobacteraceae bacterium]|nr:MAG: arginase [Xanthomonadaceae bacterium]